MTMITEVPRAEGNDLGWLVTRFVRNTAGATHAVLVSADGLAMAFSAGLPLERAEQMAAVSSGLTSLSAGAARLFQAGRVMQSIVEMEGGFLMLMSVSEGSHLAVLTSAQADVGQVGYEMALLVERVGRVMSASARTAADG